VQSSVTTFSRSVGSVLLLIVVAFFNEGRGQTAQPMGKSEHRDASQNSDRGKYIVEDIAICGQCHTPRDSDGAPDRSRWLEGAPVWLKSAEPVEIGRSRPRDCRSVTGDGRGNGDVVDDGNLAWWLSASAYATISSMSQQDAAAVVAYLKAVKPEPK